MGTTLRRGGIQQETRKGPEEILGAPWSESELLICLLDEAVHINIAVSVLDGVDADVATYAHICVGEEFGDAGRERLHVRGCGENAEVAGVGTDCDGEHTGTTPESWAVQQHFFRHTGPPVYSNGMEKVTWSRDLTRFKRIVGPEMFPEYYKVVQELRCFVGSLRCDVLAGPNLEVLIEPGFKVKAGQLYKVVVVVKTQGFRDVLLRAYVPDGGYPVVLNFMGHDVEAADEQTLLQHLYDTTPSNADIQFRLRALRALSRNSEKC